MDTAALFTGRVHLASERGTDIEPPQMATVAIDPEAVTVQPQRAQPLRMDFADVDAVTTEDFALTVSLCDGTRLELAQFGRRHDEFVRTFKLALRDYRAKNLFLAEPVGGEAFPCRVEAPEAGGEAEVRVYLTSLAILPEMAIPFGVPFGEVTEVAFDEVCWALTLRRRFDPPVRLSQMGRRTAELRRLLDDRMTGLSKRTADALAYLAPTATSMARRRLGSLMTDGVAVRRGDIDALGENVWPALVRGATGTPRVEESLGQLFALSTPEEIAIGIKETNARQDADGDSAEAEPVEQIAANPGASGGEEAAHAAGKEAIPKGPMSNRVAWFLCPVPKANAITLEATTRTGRATYVFRIADPTEWNATNGEMRIERIRSRVRDISRALVALAFRREPIYLPDETVATGQYARYRLALRLLPCLRVTRAAFVGRAIHRQDWRDQLDQALARAKG